MQLYIEKDFLDNFYIEFNESAASSSQKILATILKEYAEVEWYIDCEIETPEQFEKLKTENPFFAYRSINMGPVSINSVREHFFENSACKQTLLFTQNEEKWFVDAESKGALCFSFDNYQSKIENIIQQCHFKIDLSKNFQGWELLNNLKNIPCNKIIINDGYILTDKHAQKMADNLFPIIKTIMGTKYKIVTRIEIYTNNLNTPPPGTFEQIKAEAEKKWNRLNSVFANYMINFNIITNTLQKGSYDFHDRLIYLNFLIIDSPKGFNLLPYKKSNSQIVVDTIFDKYTYNRLRNHLKMHDDYFNEIKRLETLNFKYIPLN
jgi:hypothetical protein